MSQINETNQSLMKREIQLYGATETTITPEAFISPKMSPLYQQGSIPTNFLNFDESICSSRQVQFSSLQKSKAQQKQVQQHQIQCQVLEYIALNKLKLINQPINQMEIIGTKCKKVETTQTYKPLKFEQQKRNVISPTLSNSSDNRGSKGQILKSIEVQIRNSEKIYEYFNNQQNNKIESQFIELPTKSFEKQMNFSNQDKPLQLLVQAQKIQNKNQQQVTQNKEQKKIKNAQPIQNMNLIHEPASILQLQHLMQSMNKKQETIQTSRNSQLSNQEMDLIQNKLKTIVILDKQQKQQLNITMPFSKRRSSSQISGFKQNTDETLTVKNFSDNKGLDQNSSKKKAKINTQIKNWSIIQTINPEGSIMGSLQSERQKLHVDTNKSNRNQHTEWIKLKEKNEQIFMNFTQQNMASFRNQNSPRTPNVNKNRDLNLKKTFNRNNESMIETEKNKFITPSSDQLLQMQMQYEEYLQIIQQRQPQSPNSPLQNNVSPKLRVDQNQYKQNSINFEDQKIVNEKNKDAQNFILNYLKLNKIDTEIGSQELMKQKLLNMQSDIHNDNFSKTLQYNSQRNSDVSRQNQGSNRHQNQENKKEKLENQIKIMTKNQLSKNISSQTLSMISEQKISNSQFRDKTSYSPTSNNYQTMKQSSPLEQFQVQTRAQSIHTTMEQKILNTSSGKLANQNSGLLSDNVDRKIFGIKLQSGRQRDDNENTISDHLHINSNKQDIQNNYIPNDLIIEQKSELGSEQQSIESIPENNKNILQKSNKENKSIETVVDQIDDIIADKNSKNLLQISQLSMQINLQNNKKYPKNENEGQVDMLQTTNNQKQQSLEKQVKEEFKEVSLKYFKKAFNIKDENIIRFQSNNHNATSISTGKKSDQSTVDFTYYNQNYQQKQEHYFQSKYIFRIPQQDEEVEDTININVSAKLTNPIQLKSFFAPLGSLPQDPQYINAMRNINMNQAIYDSIQKDDKQVTKKKTMIDVDINQRQKDKKIINISPFTTINRQIANLPDEDSQKLNNQYPSITNLKPVSVRAQRTNLANEKTNNKLQDVISRNQQEIKSKKIRSLILNQDIQNNQQQQKMIEHKRNSVFSHNNNRDNISLRELLKQGQIGNYNSLMEQNEERLSSLRQSPQTQQTYRQKSQRLNNRDNQFKKQFENKQNKIEILKQFVKQQVEQNKMQQNVQWPSNQTPSKVTAKNVMHPDWNDVLLANQFLKQGVSWRHIAPELTNEQSANQFFNNKSKLKMAYEKIRQIEGFLISQNGSVRQNPDLHNKLLNSFHPGYALNQLNKKLNVNFDDAYSIRKQSLYDNQQKERQAKFKFRILGDNSQNQASQIEDENLLQYESFQQQIEFTQDKKNQAEIFSFDLMFDKDAGKKQQFDLYRNEPNDNSQNSIDEINGDMRPLFSQKYMQVPQKNTTKNSLVAVKHNNTLRNDYDYKNEQVQQKKMKENKPEVTQLIKQSSSADDTIEHALSLTQKFSGSFKSYEMNLLKDYKNMISGKNDNGQPKIVNKNQFKKLYPIKTEIKAGNIEIEQNSYTDLNLLIEQKKYLNIQNSKNSQKSINKIRTLNTTNVSPQKQDTNGTKNNNNNFYFGEQMKQILKIQGNSRINNDFQSSNNSKKSSNDLQIHFQLTNQTKKEVGNILDTQYRENENKLNDQNDQNSKKEKIYVRNSMIRQMHNRIDKPFLTHKKEQISPEILINQSLKKNENEQNVENNKDRIDCKNQNKPNNYRNMKVTQINIFDQDQKKLEYITPVRAQSIVPQNRRVHKIRGNQNLEQLITKDGRKFNQSILKPLIVQEAKQKKQIFSSVYQYEGQISLNDSIVLNGQPINKKQENQQYRQQIFEDKRNFLKEESVTARSTTNSNLTMISPKFQGLYVNKNEIKTKPFIYPVPFVYKKACSPFKDSTKNYKMEHEILQYQEHKQMIDEIQKINDHKKKIYELQQLMKEQTIQNNKVKNKKNQNDQQNESQSGQTEENIGVNTINNNDSAYEITTANEIFDSKIALNKTFAAEQTIQ